MGETSSPHPVDLHVGARIRMRRKLLRISQEELADAMGLTFQQVQKYERGANRVSCSKLTEICHRLEVPPSYFFEGLDLPDQAAPTDAEAEMMTFVSQDGAVDLARAYSHVPAHLRHGLVALVKSMASAGGRAAA